jgi:hypothetical protein
MFIQLLNKEEPVANVVTDEDRFNTYLTNYAQDGPTEGIELKEPTTSKRWPFMRRQIPEETELPILCAKERLAIQIHQITLKLIFLPGFFDTFMVTDIDMRTKRPIRKSKKVNKRKFAKSMEIEEPEAIEADKVDEKPIGTDVEMANAEEAVEEKPVVEKEVDQGPVEAPEEVPKEEVVESAAVPEE